MIEFEGVSREYITDSNIVKALDSVSFRIEESEFAMILGPSGSGKSTLLNLIGGMDHATRGMISVAGNSISEYTEKQLSEFRRVEIGFVFQFYNLIPNLTVYENVAIAQKLGKDPLDTRDILDAVGLYDRKNHFPRELSGGEMQRVSIARALCKNPTILLCDEPTGALDSRTGDIIISLLQSMSSIYKKTVVIVTHNASLVETADRIIKLKDGAVESNIKQDNPILLKGGQVV